MQASEHNAVKEAIALRLSIHKAAEKIIDNDYDVTHLTDNIMTLVLNWANPVHAAPVESDEWECNACS